MELFECTIEGRSPIEPKTKKTENVWLYSIIARYPHPHLAEGEKKTKNNTGPHSTSQLSEWW